MSFLKEIFFQKKTINTFSEAYHGITPIECLFSDREDMQTPGAQRLTFVQGR